MARNPEIIIDQDRDGEILEKLGSAITRLADRHQRKTKPWYPNEFVPYELGENFREKPWSEEQYDLPQSVRSAILVNLLTEDNLPWYTQMLSSLSTSTHPIHEWVGLWTAEEGRHSDLMREWVHNTRAIDPKLLEDYRMIQVSGGEVPQMQTVSEMLAYTSLQELATCVAHKNTGEILGQIDQDRDDNRQGKRAMGRLAGDEKHHHNFYAEATEEAIKIDPSTMVLAIAKQLTNFEMPGTGIPEFEEHSKIIAESGIYDHKAFYEKVATPTLKKWGIDNIPEEHLSLEASQARELIHRRMRILGLAANRMSRKNSLI